MIPWKIQAILDKDYDHEIPDKLRSKDFCSAIKSWINSTISRYGGKVAGTVSGWREASGFIVWKESLHVLFYPVRQR